MKKYSKDELIQLSDIELRVHLRQCLEMLMKINQEYEDLTETIHFNKYLPTLSFGYYNNKQALLKLGQEEDNLFSAIIEHRKYIADVSGTHERKTYVNVEAIREMAQDMMKKKPQQE